MVADDKACCAPIDGMGRVAQNRSVWFVMWVKARMEYILQNILIYKHDTRQAHILRRHSVKIIKMMCTHDQLLLGFMVITVLSTLGSANITETPHVFYI